MGTNYYVRFNVCPECGRDERLHIGKSSCGWVFALHVYPDRDDGAINSLEDWLPVLLGAEIRDEYGGHITFAEMINVIVCRGRPAGWIKPEIPMMYDSWQDFHDRNYSEDGPDGLIRAKVDGYHCVGHGSGTWDLHVGDFS